MTLKSVLLMFGMLYGDRGRDDRAVIAESIVAVNPTPAQAAWMTAIAFRESAFRSGAVGDRSTSFCWGQINLPGGKLTAEGWSGWELTQDPKRCATVVLRLLRGSLGACRHLPIEERLAAYAGGSCDSEYGRRVSRDRFALAQRISGGAL